VPDTDVQIVATIQTGILTLSRDSNRIVFASDSSTCRCCSSSFSVVGFFILVELKTLLSRSPVPLVLCSSSFADHDLFN